MSRETKYELSFSVCWEGYESDKAAKKARDEKYRELKRDGKVVKRWMLPNQIKQYGSNSGTCNVYKLTVYGDLGAASLADDDEPLKDDPVLPNFYKAIREMEDLPRPLELPDIDLEA